jgi:16S rRNA (guanine527-N7)-methyltransferase
MPADSNDTEAADQPETSTAVASDTLAAALARHRLELPPEQVERLDQYCRLVWDWNEKLNLTRHTDYEKFVSRDLADTLALSPFLKTGEEVLDVGSGGGVPGLVLAIVRPDLQVSLSDSVGKKVTALRDMVEKLGMEVPVYPIRGEELLEDTRFDAVIMRAVGPLDRLLTWFRPRWESMRRLLVIKGPKWNEELNEAKRRGLARDLDVKVAAEYPMAGTESQSVVLKIWPKSRPER